MSDKVRTALALVFILMLYGIVGQMDYQDQVCASAIQLVCTPHPAQKQTGPAPSAARRPLQVDYSHAVVVELEPGPRVLRCVVVS